MPAPKQKPAAGTAGIKGRGTGLKNNSTTSKAPITIEHWGALTMAVCGFSKLFEGNEDLDAEELEAAVGRIKPVAAEILRMAVPWETYEAAGKAFGAQPFREMEDVYEPVRGRQVHETGRDGALVLQRIGTPEVAVLAGRRRWGMTPQLEKGGDAVACIVRAEREPVIAPDASTADGLDLTSAFRESNPKTTLTRRSYELDRGRSALLGAAPTAHNPDGPIPLLYEWALDRALAFADSVAWATKHGIASYNVRDGKAVQVTFPSN